MQTGKICDRGFFHMCFCNEGENLALLSNIVNQSFGLIPSKTRVGNGFSVNMGSASDFLIARLQIAFDHNTFYETFDILVASSCVQNVFDDTDLLLVFLSGVGMVGVDDGSRVYEMCFVVFLQQKLDIFVVIVRYGISVFVGRTAENGVCQRVSACLYFPGTVNKGVGALCGDDGVNHNRKITACRVFHAGRNIDAGNSQTVLLVFYGTCADCNVGENIGQITPVGRIQHLVCRSQIGFFYYAHMHFTHGDQAVQQVRLSFRVRLMNDTFVAFTCGTRFVGIDTWDDDQFVGYFVGNLCQTVIVLQNSVFVVCGARSYDNKKFIGIPGKDFCDFSVTLFFDFGCAGA